MNIGRRHRLLGHRKEIYYSWHSKQHEHQFLITGPMGVMCRSPEDVILQ